MNKETPCSHCGATEGRCVDEEGNYLPKGKIHRARLLALEEIDCLSCKQSSFVVKPPR